MGVIYRDGVAYGGISSIAGNVSYDNSTSHLQSSTVQNAITELKNIIDSEEYTSIAFVNSLPAATNAQYNTLYIVDNNNDGVFELWVIKTTLGQKAWVAVGDNSKIAALQESVAALQTEISGLSYIASASIDNATGNLVLTDSDNNTVTLQLDSTPTANSKKPITSGAVYTALDDQVGKKEYVNNALKGEIFNTYSGNGKNIASGTRSHAEGFKTKASDNYSHAEGFYTTASGESSHAEGYETEAWGAYSHAEGRATDAHAAYSHVSGWGTRANTAASTVIGTYNVIDGTRSIDPKHLFIVGNGLDDNNRSNILEVSDTYLNLNGVFKQNGQVIDFSTLGDKIVEMSDIEYAALTTKDPDKVYFVYETEVDNRTITAYDSNGDFLYTMTMYGCASIGGISLDSKVTTPPTITGPDRFGSGSFIFKGTFADGNTYYFSTTFTDDRTNYGISNYNENVSDAYGTNLFFVVNGNRFNLMSAPNVSWVSSLHIAGYDESSFELAVNSKLNGFKRIYKGDELYATNEKPNADDISYDNTNSELTATTTQDAIDELNTNDVGKKEYVNNELKGEIFNAYSGNTKNVASGDRSHAEGLGTTAEGSESHAEGLHTTASGNQSHAEGNVTKANGGASHAEGDNTTANGGTSHAEGYGTITKGQSSHAEGFYAITVRNHSHAEGDNTVAVGVASHTEGVGTKALEQASHAGGYYTKSAKKYETVIGKYNLPFEDTDLIVSELIDNSYYLLTIPVYKIYYYNSYTLSATSIAIPNELKEHLPSSVGDYGIPYVICDNNKVETELWGCLRATAAGEEKTVSISMLPSYQNYLKNYNSSNLYIKVYADTTQLIDAYWKKTTETTPDSLFVIGNGRDGGRRSNIVEVDTTSFNVNGDIKQNGTTIDFSGSDVGKKEYVNGELKGEIFNSYSGNDKNIASGQRSHAEGQLTAVYSDAGHAEGKYTVVGSAVVDPETGETTYTGTGATFGHAEGYTSHAAGYTSHAEGSGTLAAGVVSHAEGYATQATGDGAHAEGYNTRATGGNSHAEGGTTAVYSESGHAEGKSTKVGSAVVDPETGNTSYTGSSAKYAHAEGYNSVAARQAAHAEGESTIASGFASHAEGYYTIASGSYAHAEGSHTTTSGDYAHAEGESTSATYANAHAEGDHTQAIARATHAEGTYTQANGISSHAGGFYTIANSKASTVIGKYNDPDPADPTSFGKLFAIGNGTADNARSNILEVSDTYLNVNGDIKQNGVSITSTPHTELTQAQYDALQNPDAGTEFFITDASSGVTISALESRLAALEMQETVYYINGVQRVPLYSQNITKVVKFDDNTVDWYFLEPTSQKTYKARVTAQGEGNTRTNPLIIVTEVSS